MIESVPKYSRMSINILGLHVMWFEAPVSDVHYVSTTVFSSVRVANVCGISLSWIFFYLGAHQQILAIWPIVL
jgi:hypothetical protein